MTPKIVQEAAQGIARLPSRALIAVNGQDWRGFLQGLITQDVETLAVGEMRYGALLTPQGRLLHDLFITGADDGCMLDVSAAAKEEWIAKLTMYRLRAKVQIEGVDASVFACWEARSHTGGSSWIVDPRHPGLGFRSYSRVVNYPDASSEEAYHLNRLRLGVPDPAKDGAETDYLIEANLDLLNGVDFKKGCFVGQETTSRMYRRGVVKTRMAPIVFDGPPPPFGAEVLAGERRAGEVRGGVSGRAIALLRIDRTGEALTCDGRPISLDLPPWLAPSFQITVDETPQS